MRVPQGLMLITIDGLAGVQEDDLVEELSEVMEAQDDDEPVVYLDFDEETVETIAEGLDEAARACEDDPSDYEYDSDEYIHAADSWRELLA